MFPVEGRWSMVPASVRFALTALLLAMGAGCITSTGTPRGIAWKPGDCPHCQANSGAMNVARQLRCTGRCSQAEKVYASVARSQRRARPHGPRRRTRHSHHHDRIHEIAIAEANPAGWQPTGQRIVRQSAPTPSSISQVKYELPWSPNAVVAQEPADFEPPDSADFAPADPTEFEPPVRIEPQVPPEPSLHVAPEDDTEPVEPSGPFVPEQSEATPYEWETNSTDNAKPELSSSYSEVDAHAAEVYCCRECEEPSFVERMRARISESKLRLHEWLWDGTYRFRIRNAAQSRALHHQTYYEPIPPTVLPGYGHYQTRWRRFEEHVGYCPPTDFVVLPEHQQDGAWDAQPIEGDGLDYEQGETPVPPPPAAPPAE